MKQHWQQAGQKVKPGLKIAGKLVLVTALRYGPAGVAGWAIKSVARKPVRMMLAVVSLGWLTVLLNLLPNHKIFCTGIGQRTMTVYICHIPIRYLIEHIDLPGDGNVLTYILSFGLAIASVYAFSRPALHTAYHAIIDFLYDKICARVFAFGNMICDRTLNRGHKMIRKVYRNR